MISISVVYYFSIFYFQPTYIITFEVNFLSVDWFIDSAYLSFHLNCCLRPFTFNVIVMLGLKSTVLFFVFCLTSLFCFLLLFLFCLPVDCLNIYYSSDLPVVLLCVFLCIAFLLVTLGVKLNIHTSCLIGVSILIFLVKGRNLTFKVEIFFSLCSFSLCL